MVKSGEGVGLAATELSDKGQNRRRVDCVAREASNDHSRVICESPREARAGEKLLRVSVILRGPLGYHLLQVDRELIGIEGTSFTDFLPGCDDLVPWIHVATPVCIRVFQLP